MLTDAGVTFGLEDAGVDEDAIKVAMKDAGAAELAVELACAKALAVSRRDPDVWVLGADQTLAFDGGLVSKAKSLDEAKARLKSMRGKSHQLHSGAASPPRARSSGRASTPSR
jgi:septum formation protein